LNEANLKNVPTYQCRREDELDYVVENLEQLVVKEAQGFWWIWHADWAASNQSEIAEFRKKFCNIRIYILHSRHSNYLWRQL
jgi:uncharacterized circularly permuted ATP-grasp superfamily protein